MPAARSSTRRLAALGAVGVVAITLAALVTALLLAPAPPQVVAAPPASPLATPVAGSPNIVYVVVDDLSSDIVPYMSEAGALAAEGVTFDNFYVTDSQCCPSRASTLTSMYPHNSKVRTNNWPDGGFGQFYNRHLDDSMGPALSAAGYHTGFIGKFLNGYRPQGSRNRTSDGSPDFPRGFVPPGWDEWQVVGAGYPNFDYTLASAVDEPVAKLEQYGDAADDYLTDVISDKTSEFLARAATTDGDEPFFLTVAPFAVHSGVSHRHGPSGDDVSFPAAPRDRPTPTSQVPDDWPQPDFPDGDCGSPDGGCERVPFPEPAATGFNVVPENAPRWMPDKPLSGTELDKMAGFRLDRIRMAQAVDDLIERMRDDLDRLGMSDDTYLVFASDNGYHLGEHALHPGKNSAFDHDIRVPLIVVPPGGAAPSTESAIVQNTDLLPTFLDIAGQHSTRPRMDGRSLLPLLAAPGESVPGWREGALVEFAADSSPNDPDRESRDSPPDYRALRTTGYLYVDYARPRDAPRAHQAELYDLVNDPEETVNRYADLSAAQRKQLDRALDRYGSCRGASCESAARRLPEISLPKVDGRHHRTPPDAVTAAHLAP